MSLRFYRVYRLNEEGRVTNAPHLIKCDDDNAAKREAERLLADRVLEVWDLTRMVARLEPRR